VRIQDYKTGCGWFGIRNTMQPQISAVVCTTQCVSVRTAKAPSGDSVYDLVYTKDDLKKIQDDDGKDFFVANNSALHKAMKVTKSGNYVTINDSMKTNGAFSEFKHGEHIPMNVGKEMALGGITLLGPETNSGGINTHQAFQTKLYNYKGIFFVVVGAEFCKDGKAITKQFVFHAAFVPHQSVKLNKSITCTDAHADFVKDMNDIFNVIMGPTFLLKPSETMYYMENIYDDEDSNQLTFKNAGTFWTDNENINDTLTQFGIDDDNPIRTLFETTAEQIGASIVQEKFRTGLSIHN